MTPLVRITISGEHPVVGAAARQPSGRGARTRQDAKAGRARHVVSVIRVG